MIFYVIISPLPANRRRKKALFMIETRLLQYFLAVAREQNITRAAQSLHIAQPTLSKQMMELEQQLGKPLFVRGKKRITLTDEGAYFRSRAQEMMDLMVKTESMFRRDEDTVAGDIWFGCGETPIMGCITQVFHDLQTEYPGLKFHIFSGDADSLLEQLDKGLLDMGLMLGVADLDKYRMIPLNLTNRFGLLMPKDSPLAARETIPADLLPTLPLIVSQQTVSGKLLRDWFGQQYESLNIIATYNLIYNATFMVEQGMGYGLCLENLVNTEGKRNLTFRPLEPELAVNAHLVVKKYQVPSRSAQLLLDEITARAGQ